MQEAAQQPISFKRMSIIADWSNRQFEAQVSKVMTMGVLRGCRSTNARTTKDKKARKENAQVSSLSFG